MADQQQLSRLLLTSVRTWNTWRAENTDTHIDLRGANLSGADLRGANLFGANLSGADLRGADLIEADLSGASLFKADLYNANLSGADLSGANLFNANLSGANLSGADLRGANLFGANLSGADLRGANLFGANLSGADLIEADLSGANLRGADLSRARIDWASHTLLAELLRQQAGDDWQRRAIAGLITASPDWCWDEFMALPIPEDVTSWALGVLRPYAEAHPDDCPLQLTRALEVQRG